jgi:hypothetical protein
MQPRPSSGNYTGLPDPSTLFGLALRRAEPYFDLDNLSPALQRLGSRELGRLARPLLLACLDGDADVLVRNHLDVICFSLCKREAST